MIAMQKRYFLAVRRTKTIFAESHCALILHDFDVEEGEAVIAFYQGLSPFRYLLRRSPVLIGLYAQLGPWRGSSDTPNSVSGFRPNFRSNILI